MVFALMPYVIANAVPDKEVGGQVELNPKLLALIFGCGEEEVVKAIEFLCSPDPESRSPKEGGRRLIKLGRFDYQVVNFEKYRAIRDEERRREQNRRSQEVFRMKLKGRPLKGEERYVRAVEEGDGGKVKRLEEEQNGDLGQ